MTRAISALAICACGVVRADTPPTSQPDHERDVDIPSRQGATIHLHVVGPAAAEEAMIVLPGGPGLSSDYLRPLARLARDDRPVIFLDPRGTGGSTKPASPDYSLSAQSDDIESVRVALKLSRLYLVGHSWGTVPALAYTTSHPERVASLILLGMGAPNAREDRRSFGAAFSARKAKLVHDGLIKPIEGTDCMASFNSTLPAHFADPRHPGAHKLPGTYRCDVGHAMLEAAGDWDYRGPLGELKLPLLLLLGGTDANLEGFRQTVAAATAPDVTEVTLPMCGHFPWIECPEPFFRAVGRFLDQR